MQQAFERWEKHATEDADVSRELAQLRAEKDKAGVIDRFHAGLTFGTGGLRGLIGAGPNRMNIYTVRQASQGLAAYLLANGEDRPLAIAYDSRIKSDLFARQAACVFAANGLKVRLFPRLMPTPVLSFAVRHLGCCAGVCVTASHNPAAYNGYKVYGEDGGQITNAAADAVYENIKSIDFFADVITMDFEAAQQTGMIQYIEEETVEAFLDAVHGQTTEPADSKEGLRVVYTPLNGTGRECVTRILERIGIDDVTLVPEQAEPDGNFPTCPSPNPENPEALQLALALSCKVQPDLLLATDPDCDRIGVAVRDKGEYHRLSGNEIGILLLDYICRRRLELGQMDKQPVAMKTIVTSDMAIPVAARYGVEVCEVLTGFKYIGEQIGALEKRGEVQRFLFGFEESCGYLASSYVRDKDGVGAAMLVCEMAQDYKARGMTLVQAMRQLYDEYGDYDSELYAFTLPEATGAQQIERVMQQLRRQAPSHVKGVTVTDDIDYLYPEQTMQDNVTGMPLPRADMLEYQFADHARLFIRPSGTEPKVKMYITTKEATQEQARRLNATLAEGMCGMIGL